MLKIIIVSSILFLPAISGELSWMRTFIPLPVLYILLTTGEPQGSALLTKAIIVASVGSLLTGNLAAILLSFSFVPLGFIIARAIQNKEPVIRTGTTGSIALILLWVIGGVVWGAIENVNPYRQILEAIDTSLTSTYVVYQQSSEIAPETLAQIEIAFNRIRNIVPVILPSIILITVFSTVWINLLLGDLLIKKRLPEFSSWPPYNQWRLPDKLVWVIIVSGAGILFPHPPINKICLNVVLLTGTLYFFQGLAVLSSLFNRWTVPWAFRLLIYTLILIQAYGIIILAIAGLADVWFDIRKSDKNNI